MPRSPAQERPDSSGPRAQQLWPAQLASVGHGARLMPKSQLEELVKYALDNGSIIVFDAAYAPFIRSDNVPKSIFEIEGAEKCAIEVRCTPKQTRQRSWLSALALNHPQTTRRVYCPRP